MRKHAITLLVLSALCAYAAQPALGVSKETVRMMEQLDALQQAMQNMQKTVDTQTAVLKTLIEQTSDNVNAMKATVADLQKTNAENLAKSQNRFDEMTREIQAMNESLEEAKTRMAKLNDQMAQMQNIVQTLNAQQSASASNPAQGAGAQPPAAGPGQDPKPHVPDASALYESGLTDYNGGRYDLAIKDFQQYLQYYPDTELASNAQFYVGECYYSQADYSKAVEEYDKCLDRYQSGSKLPTAQLKKGYSLLELGQTAAGTRELRSLIQRYPSSHEAELARQRLKKVTAASASRRR